MQQFLGLRRHVAAVSGQAGIAHQVFARRPDAVDTGLAGASLQLLVNGRFDLPRIQSEQGPGIAQFRPAFVNEQV